MKSFKFALMPTFASAVLLSSLTLGAAFASTVKATSSMHSFFGKAKMVRFNLRNQTGAPIELRAGDQTMTIEAGKTVDLKLATGTQVVTTTRTGKREAGAVVCEASPAIDDTTVVLN